MEGCSLVREGARQIPGEEHCEPSPQPAPCSEVGLRWLALGTARRPGRTAQLGEGREPKTGPSGAGLRLYGAFKGRKRTSFFLLRGIEGFDQKMDII